VGRSRMSHPGGELTEKQDRFVRLIERGVSNSEACRLVGVNRRTGTRWRFGRTILSTGGEPVHYPPVRIPRSPTPRHPRYLSLEERTLIADLHRERKTLREIAEAVGRHPSTISRELGRNSDAAGRYLPGTAQRLMADRGQRPRRRRVAVDDELRTVVLTLLGKRWSPEQVAHNLRERFPASVSGSCVPSRSTRPSTTPAWTSPGLRSGVGGVAGDACRDWSVGDG